MHICKNKERTKGEQTTTHHLVALFRVVLVVVAVARVAAGPALQRGYLSVVRSAAGGLLLLRGTLYKTEQ